MIQVTKWMVLHALLPQEAKIPIKIGKLSIADPEIKTAFGLVGAYFFFIFVSTFLLTVTGYQLLDSFFETASALGTVGLSTGITSDRMPSWTKWLLMFNMWAGRLEILPVLVVFNWKIWIGKRSIS
jgi:trk system potassium uptake protein TrkH